MTALVQPWGPIRSFGRTPIARLVPVTFASQAEAIGRKIVKVEISTDPLSD